MNATNQLTTIAALPRGGGFLAAPEPERIVHEYEGPGYRAYAALGLFHTPGMTAAEWCAVQHEYWNNRFAEECDA